MTKARNFKRDVGSKNSRIEQASLIAERQSRCVLNGVVPAMRLIKKLNFYFFLLTICVITAGCYSTGPWPRVDIVENSLGVGEIADYLLKNRFNGAVIKRVGELLPEKITEKDVCFIEKKYGLICEKIQEGFVCSYKGFIKDKFSANFESHFYERTVVVVVKWLNGNKSVLVETAVNELN